MADYCTLGELKEQLGIEDYADDGPLARVITAVSRQIENETGWLFYTSTSDETRYFTALGAGRLFVEEGIVSLTTLATDDAMDRTYSTSWTATDYDLYPDNASARGKPYTWIEIAPNGSYSFPMVKRGVKLVGKFGYSSSTPAVVKEACLLQCERIFKRKDAPFGVAGNPEQGFMRIKAELDPDVKMLLAGVKKVRL